MPGGLSRIAGERSARRLGPARRRQQGHLGAVRRAGRPGRRRCGAAGGRARSHGEPPTSSRAAEHLFWLGRYAERSENCARLLRAVLTRLTRRRRVPGVSHPAFLRACARQGLLDLPADVDPTQRRLPDRRDADRRLIVDRSTDARTVSAFNVGQTVRVAGAVRDRLSTDNWRVLNRLLADCSRGRSARARSRRRARADRSTRSSRSSAVGGLEMAHMTRDDGWRFLSLGRHLERLLVRRHHARRRRAGAASADPALLEWLLELSDSLLTYRARHISTPNGRRSSTCCSSTRTTRDRRGSSSAKLAKHVRLLPDAALLDDAGGGRAAAARLPLDSIPNRVSCSPAPTAARELLSECQDSPCACPALTLRYFSHVDEVPRATVADDERRLYRIEHETRYVHVGARRRRRSTSRT